MQSVPKITIQDDDLDIEKCRQAVAKALAKPEPQANFDRKTWLEKTKAQLKKEQSESAWR